MHSADPPNADRLPQATPLMLVKLYVPAATTIVPTESSLTAATSPVAFVTLTTDRRCVATMILIINMMNSDTMLFR